MPAPSRRCPRRHVAPRAARHGRPTRRHGAGRVGTDRASGRSRRPSLDAGGAREARLRGAERHGRRARAARACARSTGCPSRSPAPAPRCSSCSTAWAGTRSSAHRSALPELAGDGRRRRSRPSCRRRRRPRSPRITTGPPAVAPRRHRVPHARRRRRAQRAPVAARRRRAARPTRADVQRHDVVPGPRRAGGHEVGVPQHRVHRRAPARRPTSSAGRPPSVLVEHVRAARRRAASGSSTPTTRASTRSRTRSGSTAPFYPAELAAADRSSAQLLDVLPARRRARRHRRPRPGAGRARRLDRPRARSTRSSTTYAGDGRFRYLHARRAPPAELARRPRRRSTAATRGCSRASSCSTRAGSARDPSAGDRPPGRRRRARGAGGRCGFVDPTLPAGGAARSARTARSRRPRCRSRSSPPGAAGDGSAGSRTVARSARYRRITAV